MLEIAWNYSSLLYSILALSIIWVFDSVFIGYNFGSELAGAERRKKERIIEQHLRGRRMLYLIYLATWYFVPIWTESRLEGVTVWLGTATIAVTHTATLLWRMQRKAIRVNYTFFRRETFAFPLYDESWIWRDIIAFLFFSLAYYGSDWIMP